MVSPRGMDAEAVGSAKCVEPAIIVTPRIEPVTVSEVVYVTISPALLVTTTHSVAITVVLVVYVVEVDSSATTWSAVCINTTTYTARARRVM